MKIFAPQAARANLVKRDGCLLHEIIMDAPLSMTMKPKGQCPFFPAEKCHGKLEKMSWNVMEMSWNLISENFWEP